MVLAVGLAVGLVGWSLVANLAIGDPLYTSRNLVLTVLLLLLARRAALDPGALGLARGTAVRGLGWGAAATVVVAAVVAVGTALADVVGPVATLLGDRRAALPPSELAFDTLVRIPFGTALFEEVAFRGVLLAALLRVTSTAWAVGWSSLAFGLWHVAPTIVALRLNDVDPAGSAVLAAVVGAVVVTAIGGVVFCWLRLVSGSLLAPILAHWATNAFGLLAAALTQRGGS
jgi:uncharacterized protein